MITLLLLLVTDDLIFHNFT